MYSKLFAASLVAFASAFDIDARTAQLTSLMSVSDQDRDMYGDSASSIRDPWQTGNIFGIPDDVLRTIVQITAALSAVDVEVHCGCCDSDTLEDPWENLQSGRQLTEVAAPASTRVDQVTHIPGRFGGGVTVHCCCDDDGSNDEEF